jgi:hypothetical protein
MGKGHSNGLRDADPQFPSVGTRTASPSWTAGLSTGNVYRFAISPAAPPITTFNSGRLGQEVAGLGVFGELIVSQPTPTPGGGVPSAVVPTLSFPMLGVLCAALMAAALLLMRR